MTNTALQLDSLLNREAHFQRFIAEQLDPFWQQREEWQFHGENDVLIHCIRFVSPEHKKVVVIVSGLLESYVKYQELAYDFYQQGYDVWMFDHRGQGFSGRILTNPYSVYVDDFNDYVDDLATFWREYVIPANYKQRYLFAHSMGGAITTLFLVRQPNAVNAVVLSAPMAGIKLPMPEWLVNSLIRISHLHNTFSQSCVFKRKTPLSFKLNISCNSQPRYQRSLDLYYQYPEIRLYGPTYHWVKEALAGAKQMVASAPLVTTPLLLLQAGKELLVSNTAQDAFIAALPQTNSTSFTGGVIRYDNAAHEILLDQDEIRAEALNQVLYFFEQHQ